jgi:hypothetical protein
LRSEHPRGLEELQPDITCHFDLHPPESDQRFHGPNRAKSAICCCRSSDPNDDSARSRGSSFSDEFTDARCRGRQSIVARSSANESQTRRLGHFNDSDISCQPPTCFNCVTQWTAHQRGAICSSEGRKSALATVGHRHRLRSGKTSSPGRDCSRSLKGIDRTLELVGSSQNPHVAMISDSIAEYRSSADPDRCALRLR